MSSLPKPHHKTPSCSRITLFAKEHLNTHKNCPTTKEKAKKVFFRTKIHADITANLFPLPIYYYLFIRLLILVVLGNHQKSGQVLLVLQSWTQIEEAMLSLSFEKKRCKTGFVHLSLISIKPAPVLQQLLQCCNKRKMSLKIFNEQMHITSVQSAQGAFVITYHCWSWASATLSFFFSAPPLFLFY